jgi:V8-like Glu-specific endopeptidase
MDSKKQREVTFHRSPQPSSQREDASNTAETGALRPKGGDPMLAEDPDDDLPISSEQPDADNAWIGAPSYGEMGAPPPVQGSFDLEPVSSYRGSVAALPPQEGGSPAETPLLDSWYAAYGHPAIAALLRRPEIAAAIADLTLDADDRTQIAATEAYPWRCICALMITAADGSRWIGTGWLAGPRTVITASHCVYLHRHGGWVRQVEVIPGQNGSQRPYGSAVATSFRSVKGWARKQKHGYDYGAIILPADRAFGNLLGYFGYTNPSDLDLQGIKVNLAGYPSDRPHATQWYQARRLDYITPRTLEYAVDTAGGQSGAPVWCLKNGQRLVVGIHAHGDVFGNAATRLCAPVFSNISAWKREGS